MKTIAIKLFLILAFSGILWLMHIGARALENLFPLDKDPTFLMLFDGTLVLGCIAFALEIIFMKSDPETLIKK